MEGIFGSGNVFGIAESEPYYPGQHLSTESNHHHSYYYPLVKQEEFDDDVFSPSYSYGAEQQAPMSMSNLSHSVHLTPPFDNSQYLDNSHRDYHHHQQQDAEQEIDRQFKMIEEVIYKSDSTPPPSTTSSNVHDLYGYDPRVTSISVKRERREDGDELDTVTMSPTSASSFSSSSRATSCEKASDDQMGEDRKWAQMLSSE